MSRYIYDENSNGHEEWQNDVARELNILMKHYIDLDKANKPETFELISALGNIIDRVADFEEIGRTVVD